jgi:preprotein translocase subunit SecG
VEELKNILVKTLNILTRVYNFSYLFFLNFWIYFILFFSHLMGVISSMHYMYYGCVLLSLLMECIILLKKKKRKRNGMIVGGGRMPLFKVSRFKCHRGVSLGLTVFSPVLFFLLCSCCSLFNWRTWTRSIG